MAKDHFLRPVLTSPQSARRLVNATRNLLLASPIETAFDSATRRRGLLGRTGLSQSEALVIAPSNAVHTFGMQFPVDLLFVNRHGMVLKRVIALRRRRIALSLRAFAVIELAAHHRGVSETSVGDVLAIIVEPASSFEPLTSNL